MGQMTITFSELYERVVSTVQRRKMARRMSRMAKSSAFQMKKKRSALKRRSPDKIQQVARKKAMKVVRDKFYPNYNDMAFQQKVKTDQIMMAKYGVKIDKIAKKQVKIITKNEGERVAKAREAADNAT
jgi:hypothetical protein